MALIDVLFTHPFFWPEVRRGAEREIHDLGAALVERGHRVRLVTSTPSGLLQRRDVDGVDVTYLRRPAFLTRRGWTAEAATAPGVALATLGARAGVVHAWHHADAYALVRNRRLRRRAPLVLKLTGTVQPDRLDAVRVERRMFRDAVAGADEVWVNSAFARDEMVAFGRDMVVVPAGVDLHRFRPLTAKASRPTVLCTASPTEARKRVDILIAAWPLVHASEPDAQLLLAGTVDPARRAELLASVPDRSRSSVQFVGCLDDDALVAAYSSAQATVAPAVAEALGLATLESLACGTPVVGADSGATSELVTPAVGALYPATDPEACAAAIVATLARTIDAATCRAAAEPFGWERVVPGVEARYHDLLRR